MSGWKTALNQNFIYIAVSTADVKHIDHRLVYSRQFKSSNKLGQFRLLFNVECIAIFVCFGDIFVRAKCIMTTMMTTKTVAISASPSMATDSTSVFEDLSSTDCFRAEDSLTDSRMQSVYSQLDAASRPIDATKSSMPESGSATKNRWVNQTRSSSESDGMNRPDFSRIWICATNRQTNSTGILRTGRKWLNPTWSSTNNAKTNILTATRPRESEINEIIYI